MQIVKNTIKKYMHSILWHMISHFLPILVPNSILGTETVYSN
jgi:hypothetical protein